jgi:hypothetical protein
MNESVETDLAAVLDRSALDFHSSRYYPMGRIENN